MEPTGRVEQFHSVLCRSSSGFCKCRYLLSLLVPLLCRGNHIWSANGNSFLPSPSFIRGEFDPREHGPPLGLGLLRENVETRAVDRVSDALEVMGLSPPQLTSLKKVMLTTEAKCNDGSSAGFYYRLASNSRRWIVFLEGGWYCFNGRSCRSRWKTSGHLMSSLGWAEHRNVGGVLSSDPAENPHWWRSNHVYIPYCSSDCWSGTRKGSSNLTFNQVYSMFNNNYRYSQTNVSHKNNDIPFIEMTSLPFMGALILEEVVKQLVFLGLSDGHSLVLAGSSAGGIGVLLNLDNVQAVLLQLGVDADVRGIADSAWFLDNKPFAPMDCHDAHTCPPTQAMKLGHGLWKSRLPSMCGINAKDRPWECFLGYKVLPTIQKSLFIFQWVFDEAQMLLDNVGKPVSKQQWNYIHSIGERIKQSLNNISAVFAPSCISHTALTTRRWNAIKIGDVSLSDSLHCWTKLNPKKTVSKRLKQDVNNISRETFNPLFHGIRNVSEYLPIPPSSKKSEPTGKKGGVPKRIRHVKKKRRNKCRKCRRRMKVKLTRKNSAEAIIENTSGKKRFRENGPSRFTSSSSSLEDGNHSNGFNPQPKPSMARLSHEAMKMLADSPGLSQNGVSGPSGPLLGREKAESDRSSKSREKRRRKNRRKRRERRRKKQKNRRQRKRKKRKEKREEMRNKKKQRVNGKNRSKVGIESMDYFPPEETTTEAFVFSLHRAEKKEQVKEHKESVCSLHLVDTCSWPHCNPTCPPLINPYTGEEMTRVQLLRSFGLSMVDLAHALGVDLATLQAMDNKDIFLILSP